MDFSFSEEQEMLRDSVSRYLNKNYAFDTRRSLLLSDKSWSQDVWNQFAEMGLLALPIAEDTGGLGGSITDIVAVAEHIGAHLLLEPYVSSILLAGCSLALSDKIIAREWLTKIVTGEATAAFAHEEGRGTPYPSFIALSAVKSENGYVLAGEKRLVLNGAEADQLVVSARLSGDVGDQDCLVLMLIDPQLEGVEITPIQTINGQSAAHILFEHVTVPSECLLLYDAHDALAMIIQDAVIALCAEAVGVMGALLQATSEYSTTRKQFNVPIASFQAVAHRLADMKMAYTKARATLYYTTAMAEAGQATPRDIAILKGQIGKLGRAIGEAAIQTHGGVGMTDELIISHYHKHILMIDALFGDSEYHLRKVGQPA